ncbi:MAG: hypothetical protein OXC92_02445 [Flavobacteriaceae bacterium]|nr:hypothetical protein [Flavobacteriaceae bacterium]
MMAYLVIPTEEGLIYSSCMLSQDRKLNTKRLNNYNRYIHAPLCANP